MKRIDSAGSVGGLFTDGDPLTATPRTILPAEWCNNVQEEISHVVEYVNPLDGGSDTQLLEAIQAIATYAPPTIHRFSTPGTATYTTPADTSYLVVEMIGGGGGGGGSCVHWYHDATPGTAGTTSTLSYPSGGALILSAGGGPGGTAGVITPGGISLVYSPAIAIHTIAGSAGSSGGGYPIAQYSGTVGGIGGGSFFGAGGAGGQYVNLYPGGLTVLVGQATHGAAGVTKGTGGGGAGAYKATTGDIAAMPGTGGSAGGYLRALIVPTALQQFEYTVGNFGTGGGAGTGGANNAMAGGNGGPGYIQISAYTT